jgi:MerR family transcriptional regulator, heat shock protein HspR
VVCAIDFISPPPKGTQEERGRKISDSDAPPDTADSGRGLYGISVAAELVGTGVQNLRLYETRGLLEPARTGGGTRRYSADDLVRLRRISDLLAAGLNLAGIAMVLRLEDENDQLRLGR